MQAEYIEALDAHFQRGMAAFGAPEPMTLTEWAEEHFYLSKESSYLEGKWEAWPFQRAIMACMSNDDIREVNFVKSARVGYALALDTPVPTPSGWSTMGDLRPGSQVLDESGQPCSVRYVSPIYTDHQCYEIEFCDGTVVVADEGHRWLVESDQSFEQLRGEAGQGRRPLGAPVTKSGVVDTGDIYRMQKSARGRTTLAVRNAKPLQLEEVTGLPVPPYTLGLWLGDGYRVTPRIIQHRSDVETARYIEEEGIRCSVRYLDKRYPDNASLLLDVPDEGKPVSPWACVFRSMGLTERKFVPAAYLRASFDQRLALLRGLMDSDGTVGANGRCEFTNTNEDLARGVYELAVSLGMKAYFQERKTKQKRHHLQQYRVGFKPCPEINPFRLKRKAARVCDLAKPTINHRRRIVRVTPVDPVPVRCIEVDSPSSLFLCSRAMIPTHNTKMILAAIMYYAHHKRRNQALWQPSDDDRDEFVKTELDPVLRDIDVMRDVFPSYLARHKDNTLQQKKFLGSILHLRGGKAAKNYRRISVDVAYLDELSAFDQNIEKEGDAVKLAAKRIEGATFPKLIAGSTPKLKGFCLIEGRAERADVRYAYHIACAHCGEHHELTWGGKDEPHGFKWVDDDPETVGHLCPHCGVLQSQSDYLSAAEAGYWKGDDGSTIDHGGVFRNVEGEVIAPPRHVAFHVWTAYSPAVTWAQLVREFLDAYEKAQRGDVSGLTTFWNATLGKTWEGEIERASADDLRNRAKAIGQFPLRVVPKDCLILLAGADTQDNRIEVGVWGYGRGLQSWTIDHQIFYGNPAEDEVWEKVAEYLFERRFARESGNDMGIYATGIDSGGHHSNAVYEFARKHKSRRVYALRGRPAGEKSIKDGATQVDIDWRGKKVKRGVLLWHVGTNLAKDLIYGRLQVPNPGPGFINLSHELSDEWFRQFSGEVRATRMTATGSQSRWQATRKRVEAWDCAVYATWVEAYLELSRKKDEWWDKLEDQVNMELPVEVKKIRPKRAAEPPPEEPKPTPQTQQTARPLRRVAASTYLRRR